MSTSTRNDDDDELAPGWFDCLSFRALELHVDGVLHVFLYVYGAHGTLNVFVLVAGMTPPPSRRRFATFQEL